MLCWQHRVLASRCPASQGEERALQLHFHWNVLCVSVLATRLRQYSLFKAWTLNIVVFCFVFFQTTAPSVTQKQLVCMTIDLSLNRNGSTACHRTCGCRLHAGAPSNTSWSNLYMQYLWRGEKENCAIGCVYFRYKGKCKKIQKKQKQKNILSNTFLLRRCAEVGVAGLRHRGFEMEWTACSRLPLRQTLDCPGLDSSTTCHGALESTQTRSSWLKTINTTKYLYKEFFKVDLIIVTNMCSSVSPHIYITLQNI